MNKYIVPTILCIILLFNFGCTPDPINEVHDAEFGSLPKHVIDPIDNPSTPEKIALGRALFWDPILSGDKDIACVTCHHPDDDYAEHLDLSIGVGGKGLSSDRSGGTLVKRNSMTILNTAFNGMNEDYVYAPSNTVAFWDNRNKSLEEQALAPILSHEEMRGQTFPEELALDSVIARLKAIAGYQDLFTKAFGDNSITDQNIAKAIAAFERSLVANNSPFDRYARGENDALSDLEVRGMLVFSEVGCVNCHNGPMFSDYKLHVLGVPQNDKLSEPDLGAGEHEFRTASLRNLPNTGPYMHNGVFNSLEEVIEFYESVTEGEDISVPESQLDPLLKKLNFEDDQEDAIIAFLRSLSDDNFDRTIPSEVPSGLKPGGDIQ